MILIGAHQIGKAYTARPLFENLSFSIESGERIGLIGPNGAGKSTLLKILAGKTDYDGGRLSVTKGLRTGYLEQVPTFAEGATIHSTVAEGMNDEHDWEEMARAEEMIAKLGLTQFASDMLVSNLSGGWRKRVALARELTRNPDLLLLDEPTNHLDVESILELEEILENAPFATVTITHDRLFLQRVSKRIIELDRRHPQGLLSVNGDYANFLSVRDDLIATQELHETKLKNTLRRETEWLRRGAQARQTKQQARIKGHAKLTDTVNDLTSRNRVSRVSLDFISAEKNPKKLIEALGISKSYNGRLIIPEMDLLITPKSRIGLMGMNGTGKSTLIKILTQLEQPDTGTVKHAERLKVSYFEQNRESLDPDVSVMKTVCPHGDHVDYGGNKLHVRSYLSRFLFGQDQADTPVRKLSGGEQSRLLLARLMLREANLLVLDEPTNDLDIATLDSLAEVLNEFNGAIILVTHDRYFLDQMTNLILAFGMNEKGEKSIEPMVGLDQWEDWHEEQMQIKANLEAKVEAEKKAAKVEPVKAAKKLTLAEENELAGMEKTIQIAEAKVQTLTQELADKAATATPFDLSKLSKALKEAEKEVTRLYARWEQLGQ